MRKCSKCGMVNPDGKKWCQKCMKPLVEADGFGRTGGEEAESSKTAGNRSDTPSRLRGKMGDEPMRERTEDPGRIPEEMERKTPGMIYCQVCGNANQQGDNYCTYCGAALGKKTAGRSWWIPVTAVCLVIALLTGLVSIITGSRDNQYPQNDLAAAGKGNIETAKDAIAELKKSADEYGYENALSELTEKSTNTLDGDCYYRLQQNYQGIPVYGRAIICATDKNGTVTSITGNAVDVDTGITLVPTITLEQATQSISNYVEENIGYDGDGLQIASLEPDSLCIFIADDSYNSRLAYSLNIGDLEIVIDANNADVIHVSRTVYEETATGYKASDTNKSREFPIEKLGEYYYIMKDTSRGLSVYTFAGRISQDNTGFHRDRATIVESSDEVFGNTEAEIALEYEKGAQLLLNVFDIHDYFLSLGFSSSATDTNLYYNDGYDNGENALGGKVGGYGVISMGSATGVNCVDVIAHEYTHFVSRELVCWNGNAENGALNEAMSDIFGEIIESIVTESDINWVMGEFRNIAEPSAHKHPVFYKGDNWGDTSNPTKDNDKGYVHKNSTVISHAAYLMWNGIDGTAAKKISTDDLAKLWYRAMLMMPSDCNFYTCRKLVELAANAMELTTEQIDCVSEAFDKVGIFSDEEEEKTDYTVTPNSKLCVYGGNDELYGNYTLRIAEKKWFGDLRNSGLQRTISVTTRKPYELELDKGTYIFTITDKENQNHTKTFTVKVKEKADDATINIHTFWGETPVKGAVAEIRTVNGVEQNVPIEKAVITIRSQVLNQTVETIQMANQDGIFETCLLAGNYDVIVEADGYVTATKSFTVTEDEAVYLPIHLSVSKRLEQVNLYDDRSEVYQKFIFHYDSKDRIIGVDRTFIYSYDSYTYNYVFTYDNKGRLITTDCDGCWGDSGNDEYIYNDKDQLVTHNRYWGGLSEPYHQYVYTYSPDGQIATEINCGSVYRYTHILDEDGCQTVYKVYRYEDTEENRSSGITTQYGSYPSSEYVHVIKCVYDKMDRLILDTNQHIPKAIFDSMELAELDFPNSITRSYYNVPIFSLAYTDSYSDNSEASYIGFEDPEGHTIWSLYVGSYDDCVFDENGYITGTVDGGIEFLYTGDIQTPNMEADKQSENEAYLKFLRNREYTKLGDSILEEDPNELYSPSEYLIMDINQDGKEELLIHCTSNIGDNFSVLYVFTLDGNQVKLADSRMCYGWYLTYSDEYKAIAAGLTRPMISAMQPDKEVFNVVFSSFDGEKLYTCLDICVGDYQAFRWGDADEESAKYPQYFDAEIIDFIDLP